MGKIPTRTPEEKQAQEERLARMYRLLEERVKEDERIRVAKAARRGDGA